MKQDPTVCITIQRFETRFNGYKHDSTVWNTNELFETPSIIPHQFHPSNTPYNTSQNTHSTHIYHTNNNQSNQTKLQHLPTFKRLSAHFSDSTVWNTTERFQTRFNFQASSRYKYYLKFITWQYFLTSKFHLQPFFWRF